MGGREATMSCAVQLNREWGVLEAGPCSTHGTTPFRLPLQLLLVTNSSTATSSSSRPRDPGP